MQKQREMLLKLTQLCNQIEIAGEGYIEESQVLERCVTPELRKLAEFNQQWHYKRGKEARAEYLQTLQQLYDLNFNQKSLQNDSE